MSNEKRPAREMFGNPGQHKAALERACESQRQVIERMRALSSDQEFPSFDEQMDMRHGAAEPDAMRPIGGGE